MAKITNLWFSAFQFFLITLAVILIINFQNDFDSSKNKVGPRLMIKGDLLQHFVLGYNNFMADMLWLRVIQEIDYAEHQFENRGWVFHFLDAITTLDRRFRVVYREALSVLSIIIRDKEGAAYLYERGIRNFPDDWIIAYKAGYHYLHEVKDCKRAAEILEQAARNGAPSWIHGLAGRLYAKSGQYELARSVLEEALKNEKTSVRIELQKRLDQLEETYRDPTKKTLIEGLECDPPKS